MASENVTDHRVEEPGDLARAPAHLPPEPRMPHGSGVALAVLLVIAAVIIGCGLAELAAQVGGPRT